MPELSALVNDTPERLEVFLPHGEVVALAYHPARVTPVWLSKAMNQTDDPLTIAASLADVLSDWDVEDHGQPVALTAEALASLPYPVLGAFAEAIGKAASGSEEGNDSSTSPANRALPSTTQTFTDSNLSSPDTLRPLATAT